MRAYEFNQLKGIQYLNDLLTADRRSIGLLCSFQGQVPLGDSGIFYDFEELRTKIAELCSSLNVDFHVVGVNQNSLDWMDEVYNVILASHIVIVDVSDPRPNVLYELGVACSLRPNESVVITKHVSSDFNSSEVEQLQIMSYTCLHDLGEKIVQHFNNHSWPLDSELENVFSKLHNRLNPDHMIFLHWIRENHLSRNPDGSGAWHCSFKDEEKRELASYLIELGLGKYEYENVKEEGKLSWAFHPTEMGKRYMNSSHFKKFFYKENP